MPNFSNDEKKKWKKKRILAKRLPRKFKLNLIQSFSYRIIFHESVHLVVSTANTLYAIRINF